ncbi:TPA: DUF4875 domain-containing protein [Serratia fonticola]|nr:DUF4875 domain-containing protein [Serratia fonticola]
MEVFGTVLSLASFFIAFFIARSFYRKRKQAHPENKAKNITLAILTYILSWMVIIIISAIIHPSNDKNVNNRAHQEKIESSKRDEEPAFVKQLGEPKHYTVLKREDKSQQDNNRITTFWILAPDALSQQDRAATVRKAAEDFNEQTKLPVVFVFLQMNKASLGKGYVLASAKYFADGCQYSGNPCNDEVWTIEASKDSITPTQLKIFDEWYKNRNKFLSKNGDLNEEGLTNFLAKKLKLAPSDINLPYITTEKVNPYYSEDDVRMGAEKMKAQRVIKQHKEEALAKRKKDIESQFSSWDGSHIDLARRVKDMLNDPDSFKHYKTTYIDRGDHITVFMDFGGKNGFGGMVRNSISADYSLDGTLIKINN